MTGIHQVIAAASAGDAVTNSALEVRDLLRRAGPSEVYARHIAREVVHEVRRLEDFPTRGSGDMIVYHASIGEPLVHAFLLSRREPLVLVYHNVTPARYFERWDPKFAELLDLGRSELLDLRHRVSVAIAVSSFNAAELIAMGYENVHVVPPVIDPYRLTRVPPAPVPVAEPYVLYVGQILPHKRPDVLVKAMHIASTYLGSDASLYLVGLLRLSSYADVLVEMVRELNLPNVHIVGTVPTPELAGYFAGARAVVTASEHEGFCVPIVEGMAFGTPIIAKACGAIPETLGDGGLLLPPDAGPALFAEVIASVVADDTLHAQLAARAARRVSEFDSVRMQASLFSVLLEVA